MDPSKDKKDTKKTLKALRICSDSYKRRPGPSCMSHDQSLVRENEFKRQRTSVLQLQQCKPVSAASVSSDDSIERFIHFKEEQINTDTDPESQSELDKWFEEEMPLILKNEQIKFHKALSAGSPEESPRLKDENEGQKRISDAFLNFVGVCLRESKKETMADRLWGMFSGSPDEVSL